jgi:nucleotide-binding universal stress UspA family protein
MEAQMGYRDIAVFLDGSLDNSARVDFALWLARRHDARLTGVDVNSEAAFESEWSERARALENSFRTRAHQVGANVRFRIAGRQGTGWKDLYAHYADLVIATQPDPETSGLILPQVPEGVLTSAGVPMIILPHGWKPRQVLDTALVAWSPSSQASRAVHDALPILKAARNVTVFAFDPPADAKDEDLELLCDHLLAHGIETGTERWRDVGDMSAVDALFASRAMEEADIVVAGAYSHSRFRETLFGGMTKALMQQFFTPVLVSH